MKLICFWCWLAAAVLYQVRAQDQDDGQFYEPQTYKNHILTYQRLFKPSARRPVPREPAPIEETWASAPAYNKAQTAAILHHKQALTSDGNFRYEFSADNGVAAGEVIAPDGTRTGAFQYRDPSGKLIKVKYRAGKEGFQILEGSHVPKSVQPVDYPQQGEASHYQQFATQQQQQQYIQQKRESSASPPAGGQQMYTRAVYSTPVPAGNQYFIQNWPEGFEDEDDGQYHENDVEDQGQGQSGTHDQIVQKPHSFGEGYSFEFTG